MSLVPSCNWGQAELCSRPDDIKVVMALGDSITAGFLARTTDAMSVGKLRPGSTITSRWTTGWRNLLGRILNAVPLGWSDTAIWGLKLVYNIDRGGPVQPYGVPREWRGLSYPIGGDEGAITLPNIFARWTKTTGQSYTPSIIPPIFKQDDEESPQMWGKDRGLNGAVSGSTSSSLVAQIQSTSMVSFVTRPLTSSRAHSATSGADGSFRRGLEVCQYWHWSERYRMFRRRRLTSR